MTPPVHSHGRGGLGQAAMIHTPVMAGLSRPSTPPRRPGVEARAAPGHEGEPSGAAHG